VTVAMGLYKGSHVMISEGKFVPVLNCLSNYHAMKTCWGVEE
jgi:hypothetical protein